MSYAQWAGSDSALAFASLACFFNAFSKDLGIRKKFGDRSIASNLFKLEIQKRGLLIYQKYFTAVTQPRSQASIWAWASMVCKAALLGSRRKFLLCCFGGVGTTLPCGTTHFIPWNMYRQLNVLKRSQKNNNHACLHTAYLHAFQRNLNDDIFKIGDTDLVWYVKL